MKSPDLNKHIEVVTSLLEMAVDLDWPLCKVVKNWEDVQGGWFPPISTNVLYDLAVVWPFTFEDINAAFGQGAWYRKILIGGEFSCLP